MKPIEFEGQTTLLGPPKEMARGTCGALPVFIDPGKPGELPAFASYWKPSAEDLVRLNAGEYVQLTVYGGSHPPVWVDIGKVQELP